ncbi:MAG: hypothetical protein JO358_19930 [Alphaproteobacteria bacterium]|nr:hypothetical protein [Alphaproteobacteria bacterium]
MKYSALLLVAIGAMIALPAIAQAPGAAERTRVAGTIATLDGDRLTVKATDGGTQTVILSADAQIYGIEKRHFSDIKPGDFVASGGVRGADGQIHAVEVRIFPESMRGIGEGQRPWDVRPEGVMTNATVGTVSQTTDGGIVHVTYKGGQSEYVVGPEVPVLAYVLADRTLLKTGAVVVTIAAKQPDGSLLTNRVTAEKDGVKPPM